MQVWTYMWNWWYTYNQWKLWAWSVDTAICVLKMTMVVESQWQNLKHRNLQEFNQPKLDLVTHIILNDVLPCMQRMLNYIQNIRWAGQAKALAGWQTDFHSDWLEMSHCDEHRLIERQLKWYKAPKKTKGWNEWLAQLAEEESRP